MILYWYYAELSLVSWPGQGLTPPGPAPYLRHPLAVLGLQALLGLLEVGVLVVFGGRLQVVVHGIRGAGHGCGNCKETKKYERECWTSSVEFRKHTSRKEPGCLSAVLLRLVPFSVETNRDRYQSEVEPVTTVGLKIQTATHTGNLYIRIDIGGKEIPRYFLRNERF